MFISLLTFNIYMTTNKNALFSPLKLGDFTLKHRVVLSPMSRFRSNMDATPNDLVADYYAQRASEGGLLIVESTLITPLAGGLPHTAGIWNKDQIEAWKKVTHAVHNKKGVIFLQLIHMGRTGSRNFNPNQEQVVSASSIRVEGKTMTGGEYEVPRELEIDEIKSIIQDFVQAAKNAVEAGFDGVEIHGANGFLVDQFTNSNSNVRSDIYGGSLENRARFALEVVGAVSDAIGAEKTAIRFSPEGKYHDMNDENPVETWSYLTTELQKRHPNLAYLHFIEPRSDFFGESANSTDSLEPYRKIWKGPFISAGGFTHSINYAKDLAEKTGDLVAFGRAFLANPDLPERIRNGWELNKYDRNTFYTNEAVGYTDYPFYNNEK